MNALRPSQKSPALDTGTRLPGCKTPLLRVCNAPLQCARNAALLRAIAFACLSSCLTVSHGSAAGDATLTALNAARASAACRTGDPAPPLRAHPQLDAAALALAQAAGGIGKPLDDTLRQTGYRATRSMFIQVGGVAAGDALARFIAQRYCAQLASDEWQEIGLHQRLTGTRADTWLILASPFTAPAIERTGEIGARVLELVNLARQSARNCGDKAFPAAPPLKWSERLMVTSLRHAEDMAAHSYFSHDGRDGSKPAERATRAGYVWRAVGENIAAGQGTAETAVQGWIDSPPHCANLMARQFTEMGTAFAINPQSKMGIYWAQVFGTPR